LNKRGYFLAILLLYLGFPKTAGAVDFGLVVNQSGEYAAGDGTEETGYSGSCIPWISGGWAGGPGFYLSAKLGTAYEGESWKYGTPPLLFEVGRSELYWRPLPALYLEMGRVRFEDPSGFVAAGLFDGITGSLGTDKVRLKAAGGYTGLLYKETAKIMMSQADAEQYSLPLDYEDSGTYFASRRVLVSLGAEFPSLTRKSALALNGLAQFDANGRDSLVHSQYVTVKYTFMPLENLDISGKAAAGLGERETDLFGHFAAGAGFNWEVPGDLQDMAQGEVRWSSGNVNEEVAAFMPVNGTAQGTVFTPRLSGLMTVKAVYAARVSRAFSVQGEGAYFLRTDGETVSGAGYPPSSYRALGGELYGSVVWVPLSDVMVRLGGGAFFPQWGDVFNSDAAVQWKIAAVLVLSL
jgi:hypothetical protein